MSEFNFKSSVCTSREQSEALLKLGLKKETADCNLNNYSLKGKNYQDDWQVGTVPYSDCLESWRAFAKDSCWELIPAWSLHRLIEMMPTYLKGFYHFKLIYNVHDNKLSYRDINMLVSIWDSCNSNMFDNCINCIEWLIKEGYFNKEYLEE